MTLATLMKQLSAFLPQAMSMVALATVVIHIVRFGAAREADEGTSARIFQLLLVLQLPIVAFFAIKWLPREPRLALLVLILQALAGLAALALVFLFQLIDSFVRGQEKNTLPPRPLPRIADRPCLLVSSPSTGGSHAERLS